MKKVLVIDESPLFRRYLGNQLSVFGLNVITAVSGLDGLSKMRTELPDLIITDYFLSRISCLQFLKSRMEDVNGRHIPVVIISKSISRDKLVQLNNFKINRFLSKPIKVDALAKTIEEILQIPIKIDPTPCSIDIHLNESILFVELARGLNREKINLMQFKAAELINLHRIKFPLILVMMTSIEGILSEESKMASFLDELMAITGNRPRQIRILSVSHEIKNFIYESSKYSVIGVSSSLNEAMGGLMNEDTAENISRDRISITEKLLGSTNDNENSVELRFEDQRFETLLEQNNFKIAALDDDPIVHGIMRTTFKGDSWILSCFFDGETFLRSLETEDYDLLFLDLIMPGMSGQEVLKKIKEVKPDLPVIVLSAVTDRSQVMPVIQMGINSYLIKPVRPEPLKAKALTVVGSDF